MSNPNPSAHKAALQSLDRLGSMVAVLDDARMLLHLLGLISKEKTPFFFFPSAGNGPATLGHRKPSVHARWPAGTG